MHSPVLLTIHRFQALEALQQAVAATEEALALAGTHDGVQDGWSEDEDDDEDNDDNEDNHHIDSDINDISYGHLQLALQESNQATMAASSNGPHAQGRVFASWEHHTRGIGSKLMAAMGYTAGRGLGRSQQGIPVPLQVVLGSFKAGLGATGVLQCAGTCTRVRISCVYACANQPPPGQAKLQHAQTSPTKKRRRRRRAAAAQQSSSGGHDGNATANPSHQEDMFSWLNTSSTRSTSSREKDLGGGTDVPAGGASSAGPHTGPLDSSHTGSKKHPPRTQGEHDLYRKERVQKLQRRLETLRATLKRHQNNPGVMARVKEDLVTAEEQLAREQRGVASAETRNAQQQAVKKLLRF